MISKRKRGGSPFFVSFYLLFWSPEGSFIDFFAAITDKVPKWEFLTVIQILSIARITVSRLYNCNLSVAGEEKIEGEGLSPQSEGLISYG